MKDAGQPISGTYRFHYKCAGHQGAVLCHYDKSTGKFDQDQIIPDN